MRKTVLSLTIGMAALCALTMLTAAIADELSLDEFDDLGIIITEDAADADDILPAPGARPAPGDLPIPAGGPSSRPAGSRLSRGVPPPGPGARRRRRSSRTPR